MLYESMLFLIALGGSAVGGWIDLKTTEIPDVVPASMAALGILAHIINALSTGAWTNVYYSIGVGLAFLALGYILYYTGQWGEADVLLLAAVGVVIPLPLSFFRDNFIAPFPAVFVLNTFIVGGLYSMIYSIVVALRKREVFQAFIKALKAGPSKKEAALLGVGAVLYFAAIKMLALVLPAAGLFAAAFSIRQMMLNLLLFLPALAFIFIFYKFAHAIDTVAFRKKVGVADLREGDVLAEDIAGFNSKLYVGLQKSQIEKIAKVKSEVWIKEGIRYGPTFFIALIATWLWGNILAYIIAAV